ARFGRSAQPGAALACLLGVLAFAIHAWFDFPGHIPVVAGVATFLFAAARFLFAYDTQPLTRLGRRTRV
ncbi:MAG: hypothetical protein ACRDAM_11960, partial [Casimicrobium sp.]